MGKAEEVEKGITGVTFWRQREIIARSTKKNGKTIIGTNNFDHSLELTTAPITPRNGYSLHSLIQNISGKI